jgi:hypothetical protein
LIARGNTRRHGKSQSPPDFFIYEKDKGYRKRMRRMDELNGLEVFCAVSLLISINNTTIIAHVV